MIVKMLHLDLVCVAGEKENTLSRLRELKAVHLDLNSAAGGDVAAAKSEASDLETAVRAILKARKGREDEFSDTRARTVSEILVLQEDRDTLASEKERLEKEIKVYAPYGDFDPALARKLIDLGIDIADKLPEKLPLMRLSKMQEKLGRIENRINIDDAKLAGSDEKALLSKNPFMADKIAFAQAKELMEELGAVAAISGWVPENAKAQLSEEASANGWGILLRDALPDENPPTLVEPPKLFRPVKALFDGLGIAPAYTEADVSVPFMCYFSLFFAMLVGDGAYGAIFLLFTLLGWKKYGVLRLERLVPALPVAKSWLVMLTVFSSATILWGLLSNTWFGAQIPWCASWPTVKWLADPSYNNMMLLCFTIGVSHLILARIWNGICKINDTTSIAEFGWAGVLLFMYFVTNSIVGIFKSIPSAMFWVFGISLIAIFAFTVKPSELKSRGAELGMLPLNIMSALGDIISYVRLFAVGLASVKVAENFNSMATGLLAGADVWWLKAVMSILMVLILILGHALNLAMAGLSILVHAVRLNTLEFSNHKGISWSGYAFKPFKKTKE
jgi:V/A-type H+-transporting ATPase subunit I